MPIRANPTLSEDLIGEILVRVPVKSLLCFQLVCKAWLSLIKEPAFVKSQLLRAIKTQTHQTLIYSLPPVIYSLVPTRSQEEKFLLLDVDSRQIVADLKSPYSKSEPVAKCTLVGSVNGIVCLNVSIPAIKFGRNFCLWNPATRKSKLIPLLNLCHPTGFGYDPIDDDYKVVSTRLRKRYSFEVYLANRDVWRKVPDPIHISRPDFMYINRPFDMCINGFLCRIENHGMMVVFDLHKEVLNCAIKLPVIIRDVHHDDGGGDDDEDEDDLDYEETCIAEFNKSIAVIKLWYKGQNDGKKIGMWMLNDNACLGGGGYEASWTPMFSIDLAAPAQLFLGYFNNRDLLVLSRNMWISCNVDKKEAKIVPLSIEMAGHDYTDFMYLAGFVCTNAVHKYTESLVSLPGFEQINWNAGKYNNFENTVDFHISVNPADFDIFVPEWLM